MTTDATYDRTPALRRAKLRALVADRWSPPGALVDADLPGGAALLAPGSARGWVLIDDGDVGSFGAAMMWALRRGRAQLDVLVEDRRAAVVARDSSTDAPADPAQEQRQRGPVPASPGPGTRPGAPGALVAPAASSVIARRARAFASPPAIWRVAGRSLQAAEPAPPAQPPPQLDGGAPGCIPPPAVIEAMSQVIEAGGAEANVEHGVLRAEVLGLEVARVVAAAGGGWALAVGAGRHDREARGQLRPGEDPGEGLAEVVRAVTALRNAGANRHPANSLAQERWLRAIVVARPQLVGAAALVAVAPPLPRGDLRAPAPAPAMGAGEDGRPVVVVCSVGVHADLVPTAADARALHRPDAHLVLVLPESDAYPVTRQLAAALIHPAEIRTVVDGWRSL